MNDNGHEFAGDEQGRSGARPIASAGKATAAAAAPSQSRPSPIREAPAAVVMPRLGEELPIFCERCGYSLKGLPQLRCDACRVLHFSCPECDHHQPINTLRPAVQRALGRLRALGLALIVFLKLNYFGWTLFAWGGAGMSISYGYDFSGGNYRLIEPRFDEEGVVILLCFGFAFAVIARMLLLRWRSGALVGLSLAGLVVLAWYLGAFLRTLESRYTVEPPFNSTVLIYVASAAAGVLIGAACAWGIWLALAHAFLPKRAAVALIEWQKAMSAVDPRKVQTDAATSVTA